MTITELITFLEGVRQTYGDLQVVNRHRDFETDAEYNQRVSSVSVEKYHEKSNEDVIVLL